MSDQKKAPSQSTEPAKSASKADQKAPKRPVVQAARPSQLVDPAKAKSASASSKPDGPATKAGPPLKPDPSVSSKPAPPTKPDDPAKPSIAPLDNSAATAKSAAPPPSNPDDASTTQQDAPRRKKRTPKPEKFGCFFNDGVRRVDYVIVWEESLSPADAKIEQQKAAYRRRFENNLMDSGVEIERTTNISDKKRTHFVKIFITWETMCYYAEYLGFRAPLELFNRQSKVAMSFTESRSVSETMSHFSPLQQEVPNKPAQFYTCAFSMSKLGKFLGSHDQDSYFRPTQRFEVAYEILGTLIYGRKDLSEVGIDRMIKLGIYSCAFPPHDGDHIAPPMTPPSHLNLRQILNNYWAQWSLWYKFQPLDHIREYFGEKIGFYFAFLGFYTTWLAPASIIGVLVFIYGLFSMNESVVVQESCNSGKTHKMCPLCKSSVDDPSDECNYWYLSDICNYIKAGFLFDNESTVIYSIFVSFWACLFLEHWKRRSSALAYQWDVIDFVDVQERPRPEYTAKCTEYAEDPVTGNMEPHFPFERRIPRLVMGVLSVVFMMILSTICLFIMLLVRSVLMGALFGNPMFRSRALTLSNMLSAVINLVLVLLLELLYEKFAFNITNWEMHRTQTDFENSVIVKVFTFELFNHYISIGYTALVKGYLAGKPGKYTTMQGISLAQCFSGSCMLEVTQVLAVITIGKQIAVNIVEIVLPKLITFAHRYFLHLKPDKRNERHRQWEADYTLIPYDQGLFMEYLEIITQFGFITLFVPAFPLAPLFALLNNLVEIRLDARKLVKGTRRPLPERTQDIGVWFSMLTFMVHLSTVSNALMMAFTSEFLPTLMYKLHHDPSLKGYKNFTLSWAAPNVTSEPCQYSNLYTYEQEYNEYYWKLFTARLAFALGYQQFVVTLSSLINHMIPDVTEELGLKMKRQKYLSKQAMIDAGLQTTKRARGGLIET